MQCHVYQMNTYLWDSPLLTDDNVCNEFAFAVTAQCLKGSIQTCRSALQSVKFRQLAHVTAVRYQRH